MDENFFVTVSGDAAKGLIFSKMHGQESLGHLFEFAVELLSEDAALDLSAVVGQSLTTRVELPGDAFRYFNGLVAQFKLAGTTGGYVRYQAIVRPKFWLLTRTANSRIFQRKTVPNVVKQIFRDRGLGDFEDRLSGNYRTWEYLVQYRESDWNFVSRILEQEGIYFYFQHEEGKHTLVLADSAGAHDKFPGYETIPYFPADDQRRTKDNISVWTVARQLVAGAYAAKDFNFETPKLRSLNRLSAPAGTAHDDLELFHYPGTFLNNKEGEDQVRVRLQEQQVDCEVFEGGGEVRGIGSGLLFTLEDHPREDQNQEYLVIASWYEASVSGYEAGGTDTAFRCSFAAIPSVRQFRAAETTSKPRVEGPQTAIVVGPSGEEIWTDKYGRVKLQFHWDRDGKADENSSCWVRVSQIWAGTNWGAMHIPRIGQEVIVDFLEGDPDRPIVTGRVYNADNMPPYGLPGKQTQSGIKSRSTKGGASPNANEIRFEDLKGSEEFFVQAEKDLNSLVKNNETRNVNVDRTTAIGANESLTVGKNRTAHVKVDEKINVDGNESMTVGGSETRSIVGDETVSIGGDDSKAVAGSQDLAVMGSRSQAIAIAETIVVGAAQSITAGSQSVSVGSRTKSVATNESASIGGNLSEDVGGDMSTSVGGGHTESIGKDQTVSISGGQTVTVGKKGALSVSQQLVIDAGDEVVIKAGDASITLKKNGDIILKGKNLISDASGKLSLKAGSDMTLKGSKISQN